MSAPIPSLETAQAWLERSHTLRSLSLCNSTFREMAQPLLFTHLVLNDSRNIGYLVDVADELREAEKDTSKLEQPLISNAHSLFLNISRFDLVGSKMRREEGIVRILALVAPTLKELRGMVIESSFGWQDIEKATYLEILHLLDVQFLPFNFPLAGNPRPFSFLRHLSLVRIDDSQLINIFNRNSLPLVTALEVGPSRNIFMFLASMGSHLECLRITSHDIPVNDFDWTSMVALRVLVLNTRTPIVGRILAQLTLPLRYFYSSAPLPRVDPFQAFLLPSNKNSLDKNFKIHYNFLGGENDPHGDLGEDEEDVVEEEEQQVMNDAVLLAKSKGWDIGWRIPSQFEDFESLPEFWVQVAVQERKRKREVEVLTTSC